jgi:hypothetical protein
MGGQSGPEVSAGLRIYTTKIWKDGHYQHKTIVQTAGRAAADMAPAAGQESMMTREQLLHLFSRFSFLTSLPGRSRSSPISGSLPIPGPSDFL